MSRYIWTSETPRIRSDGTRIEEGEEFDPTDHEQRVWPDRMRPADGTCDVELSSGDRAGERCGRDRPCPYHDDVGGE
jgi:hypothetical protein